MRQSSCGSKSLSVLPVMPRMSWMCTTMSCCEKIWEVKLDVTASVSDNAAGMVSNSEPSITMVNFGSPCFSKSILVEIIENIRQINSQFEEISRDREALRLTNEEGKRRDASNSNLPVTSHLMNPDGIFGRIGDKMKIINFLLWGVDLDEKRNVQLRVIPILGMGGIGKTTLAQIVYDDPLVQSMFDIMAWVYVSPEFDIIRLTKDIIEIVTGNSGSSFDGFSKIHDVLQKELTGKAVLLVLDDVWNMQQNDWEMLFLSLRAAKRLRVLVTSRNDSVVHVLNTISKYQLSVTPHWLNILSECESCNLLYNCAIRGENMKEEIHSLDIGFQMIKKCGGLPLAIRCIGGILRYNNNKDSWKEILDSELWESDEFEPVLRALKVSYYHLPKKLRACFLFCSLFPKGSELRKTSIVYMWMAHGFLQPVGRKKAEDLGADYLDELQMRSFIVPCTKGSFCLHDVIYDLARSLSGGEIHTIINEMSDHVPEFDGETLPESLCLLYHLQTLKIVHCCHLRELPMNIANLVNLRYLRIAHAGIEEIPLTLWKVHNIHVLHLKECCNITVLPHGISNLVNLHSLKLKTCKQLKELPADIGQLINLKLLDLSFTAIRRFPASICLLVSTKLVVAGLPRDVWKQLNSDLEISNNLSTGGCNVKQKQKKWNQKLTFFDSPQWLLALSSLVSACCNFIRSSYWERSTLSGTLR